MRTKQRVARKADRRYTCERQAATIRLQESLYLLLQPMLSVYWQVQRQQPEPEPPPHPPTPLRRRGGELRLRNFGFASNDSETTKKKHHHKNETHLSTVCHRTAFRIKLQRHITAAWVRGNSITSGPQYSSSFCGQTQIIKCRFTLFDCTGATQRLR
ncbi:hypothetical protein F2P81_002485 [Scophthalmus maximus]|uniref:Uncharacterized protein n=1 Tax=Scophthalmus maximus TaxID=52904 RepID=A0A6A4TEI3_SCOMX|nr:hypothetical protein F2P81_002485 [Scophthalmus maximus]